MTETTGSGAAAREQGSGVAQAFAGLPIESLMLDPILAAAKGQAALAAVTLDFVTSLAFEDGEEDGSSEKPRKAKLINVDLDRLAVSQDGAPPANLQQKIQMPLLPLVEIPNFSLESMEIDFTMEVKSSVSETDSSSSEDTKESETTKGGSVSAGGSFWGVSFKASANYNNKHKSTGTVSASKEKTRSTDSSAKYHLNVKAKQNAPTEGMSRFTQILASVIEPIDVPAGG